MKGPKTGGRIPLVAITAAVALAAAACGGAAEGEFSFEGKRVEILVPTGAGGGTDTTARFIAEKIGSHLPAKPRIQVTNVEGASHIIGMNEFENQREHDGLHWMVSSGSGHLPYMFGEKDVQFDLAAMSPILASPVGNVVLVRDGSSVDSISDLDGARLIYGGSGPVGSDTTQLLGLHILGIDIKPIFGFDEGPQRIAFEQGEIDVIYNTTPAYLSGGKDLVDRGVATPLYTAGQLVDGEIVRDPAFPDLPSIVDVYEELHGSAPSGPEWEAYKALIATTTSFSKVMWLHGDAPEEAVTQVTEAAKAMVAEPGFDEDAAEILGGYELTVGADAGVQIQDAFSIDKSAVEWLRGWLKDEFDAVPGE